MKNSDKVIIIGAGGHANVIADAVVKSGGCLSGFLDDKLNKGEMVSGYPVLGKESDISGFVGEHKFVIGIGDNYTRKMIAEKYNVGWHTVMHPSAVVAMGVEIGPGTVIMANSVINALSKIGRHCIINSGAVVEHDNDIAEYAHISPRAATGGTVAVGHLTHIGIGAVVKNNITIAPECIIGAGAVVVGDITEKGTYIGIPAKKIK